MALELIETIEVGAGGAASIEFTSIPQDGVDLLLVVSGRSTDNAVAPLMSVRINNDSTSAHSFVRLYGTGSSALTSAGSTNDKILAGRFVGANATSNTFNNSEVYISNYTSSTSKAIQANTVSENNGTEAYQSLVANKPADTNPVQSIQIFSTGNLAQYSTASLYKIY